MSEGRLVWRPKARDDLLALYDWIADRADADTAFTYTAGIEAVVAGLGTFSARGTPRDDLEQGLRTLVYRRRTVIAYRQVDGTVEVLRLIRAGQDWDAVDLD